MRRKIELAYLDLKHLSWSLDRRIAIFTLPQPTKTFNPSHISRDVDILQTFEVSKLDSEPKLCPVRCLTEYIRKTTSIRRSSKLFITTGSHVHYKPTALPTIHRWIKVTLAEAKVDLTKFSMHSVRAATSSAAIKLGLSMDQILGKAGWVTDTCFTKTYYKHIAPSHVGEVRTLSDGRNLSRSSTRFIKLDAQAASNPTHKVNSGFASQWTYRNPRDIQAQLSEHRSIVKKHPESSLINPKVRSAAKVKMENNLSKRAKQVRKQVGYIRKSKGRGC